MTPEEGYLFLSVLAAWVFGISAMVGLILERRDRKTQLDQMNETVMVFIETVKSYEKAIKKAPKSKVDPSIKAEVEKQKTAREQARLEKEKVKRGTEALKTLGKLFSKK